MSELIKCDSCSHIVPFPDSYFHLEIERLFTSKIRGLNEDIIDKKIDLCEHCFNNLIKNNKQIFK